MNEKSKIPDFPPEPEIPIIPDENTAPIKKG